MSDPRRFLPSVDMVLLRIQSFDGSASVPHCRIVETTRLVLDEYRKTVSGEETPTLDEVAQRIWVLVQRENRKRVHKVVNGTGIVLHTGLGRAALPREAMDALANLDGCCNVQIDLETGLRGRRDGVVEELLRSLTGAEASTVVNNNAGATLLVLAALCRDREVIVSRGQLIEIGGSFRLPDVIGESGAKMVEVGTTNKTHLRDYSAAITEQTSVLLHVNPSNYRIVGFVQQVSTSELVGLKKTHPELIVVDDLGCGALVNLESYGLPHEATVQDSLKAGADVALFSGDKLIGGPQSGIILGKRKYIDLIRKHPLARALRVGKFTIAALEATLSLFLDPQTLLERNPTLRMLTMPVDRLQARATQLAERLAPLIATNVVKGFGMCGGGALPTVQLDTFLVAIHKEGLSADELARNLRSGDPCIVTRVESDQVLIDVRTLLDSEDDLIELAIKNLEVAP